MRQRRSVSGARNEQQLAGTQFKALFELSGVVFPSCEQNYSRGRFWEALHATGDNLRRIKLDIFNYIYRVRIRDYQSSPACATGVEEVCQLLPVKKNEVSKDLITLRQSNETVKQFHSISSVLMITTRHSR